MLVVVETLLLHRGLQSGEVSELFVLNLGEGFFVGVEMTDSFCLDLARHKVITLIQRSILLLLINY